MSEQPNSIYHDLIIKAPIENVYNAITEPKHLINWWPLNCSGEPIVGKEYNFYFGPDYNWFGEVTEALPNTSFHVKMTKSDSDWNPTTFGFDLSIEKEITQIQFWHKGWPECNAHFKRSSYCWAILLSGLKNYVEKGIIIPFEERE